MHQNEVDYAGFASVEGYAAIPLWVVVRVYPYVVTGLAHFVTFFHTMVCMGRRRGMSRCCGMCFLREVPA